MCLVFIGRGVAQPHCMKSHKLLTSGALMVMLVLMPAAANAQRGSGRHHGGRTVVQPVVIVAQPIAVRATVAKPIVVAPHVVVRQPIIGRTVPRGSFGRSSFGSIPIRTGFGTVPVRTGFGTTTPVRTGFGVQPRLAPVPVTIGRRQASRSNGFRALKPRHVAREVVVVAYPVPYPYAYPPQHVVTTSSAGSTSHGSNITVYGAGGVSEGPSMYSADSGGRRFERVAFPGVARCCRNLRGRHVCGHRSAVLG